MKIAIVGAGYTALTAAYHLGRAGHEVTLYEALPHAGGLAAGFKDEAWDWPLEKFYHHLFTGDESIINLSAQLGIADKLSRYSPSTDLIYEDKPYPFDGPMAVLRYPGFSFMEKAIGPFGRLLEGAARLAALRKHHRRYVDGALDGRGLRQTVRAAVAR